MMNVTLAIYFSWRKLLLEAGGRASWRPPFAKFRSHPNSYFYISKVKKIQMYMRHNDMCIEFSGPIRLKWGLCEKKEASEHTILFILKVHEFVFFVHVAFQRISSQFFYTYIHFMLVYLHLFRFFLKLKILNFDILEIWSPVTKTPHSFFKGNV